MLLSDGALIPRLPPADHPEGTRAAQEDRAFLLPGRGPCPSTCLPRGALLGGAECGARCPHSYDGQAFPGRRTALRGADGTGASPRNIPQDA